MAKLYYKFGTMAAGKSLELLKTATNYERQNKTALVLTSATDTRDGIGKVASRNGEQRDATPINDDTDFFSLVLEKWPNVILVDEAQFLSEAVVRALARVVDVFRIPVICYGLKNTFDNKLFEGTAALVAHADKLEEIKAVCAHCDAKATMNMRTVGGKPVYEGETIQLGGDDDYIAVCREHYYLPIIEGENNE